MSFMESWAADARVIAEAAANTAGALLWAAILVLLTAFLAGLLYHLAGRWIMDWAEKRHVRERARIEREAREFRDPGGIR